MKEKLILIIAIVSGLAAMFLTRLYINKMRDDLNRRFEMVEVLVAATQINEGTVLKPELQTTMLAKQMTPKRNVSSRNITPDHLNLIVGRTFKNSVPRGSPLTWSDIMGDDRRGGNVASMINENERALSIPVDSISSVTGHIEPNDHIDILGTFTFPSLKGDPQLDTVTLTILQNVTVLATGKETSQNRSLADLAKTTRKSSYSAVTLLVTPKEAEMLTFAMQKGRLTLTLRNPSDVSSARDLTSINFNYLEKKVGEFNEQRQERLRSGALR